MNELICRKSGTWCATPGMCSPHGGCPNIDLESGKQLFAENNRLFKLLERMVDQILPVKELKDMPGYSRVLTAETLLAERDQLFGETEQLKAENEVLRKALTTIREDSTDLSASECAADALVDSCIMDISKEKSQAISDRGRDAIVASMADEPVVNFDMERMEKALAGDRHVLPQGLTKEQIGEHICATAKSLNRRDIKLANISKFLREGGDHD